MHRTPATDNVEWCTARLPGVRDPDGRIDDAMWLAGQPDVIFTCFGDMMRVPGRPEACWTPSARRRRAVRLLPARRAESRGRQPRQHVVFFALGLRPPRRRPRSRWCARVTWFAHFSVFCNHVTIVPPIKAILDSRSAAVGFIGPARVDRGRQPAVPIRA